MAAVPIQISQSISTQSVSTGRRQDEEGGDEEADVWAALERLSTYDQMPIHDFGESTEYQNGAEAGSSQRY
ncbi:unnamed protein product [Calypogeia fissa]